MYDWRGDVKMYRNALGDTTSTAKQGTIILLIIVYTTTKKELLIPC